MTIIVFSSAAFEIRTGLGIVMYRSLPVGWPSYIACYEQSFDCVPVCHVTCHQVTLDIPNSKLNEAHISP